MKQRYVIVPAPIILLAYWIYDWFSYPLERNIPDDLIHAVAETESSKLNQNIEFLSLWEGHSKPADVYEKIPQNVIDLLGSSDIYVAYFSLQKNGIRDASFVVDRLLGSLRSRWYYLYSTDGLIEEEIVPSLSESLGRKKYPYHYCERSDVDNWFFCTSDDL